MGRLREEAAAWEGKIKLELVQKGFPVTSGGPESDADAGLDCFTPDPLDSPTLGVISGKTTTDHVEPLNISEPKSIMKQGSGLLHYPFPLDCIDLSQNTLEKPTNDGIPAGATIPSLASSFISQEAVIWGENQENHNKPTEFIDPSVLNSPVKNDTDSGDHSMEATGRVPTCQQEDGIQEERETAAADPDSWMVDQIPESPNQAYYQLFDANSMIPSNEMNSLLRQKLDPLHRPSILHTIPCRNDHMDVVLNKRNVCDCGVTQVHAVCMCLIDLPDRLLLTVLKHVFKKDEMDGAGNTPLHYVAAAGRREVLEYMLASGVNSIRLNTIGQSFLHVLDASRFSDDLINFLGTFKESGLLEQRDHNGRTVLHGLLRNPILPHVYHDLIDFYGPERAIQFSLRDNQGLNAAQHIRNVAQAQIPCASYGHVGYAQATVVYDNIANRFITPTEIPGNSVEETQNRIAVLRDSNPSVAHSIPNAEDSTGRNALHCLVLPPRTCTLEDKERRLDKLKQYIFFGADINHYDQAGRTPLLATIIESPSPTNESATKAIVELLCQSGANVHQKDRDGNTALYHAIRKGYCDCVAILLQHGAHVNFWTLSGRSYRMFSQDCMQEYLQVNDQEGFDMLQKRLAVVSALVSYGAVLEPTPLQAWGLMHLQHD
ncbi:hypothetical protein EYC84_006743 [Monilinia fructicola]|uniref:Uncharacterized protein n=1 Tax=Monilinia fructicola TaxID=38448 RepID=A0A5M9KCI5_MONFR|nr:hypothetical protein EYC84_006743 [Monilinia fructicola]